MTLSRYSWSIEYLLKTKYSVYYKLKNAAISNISKEGRYEFMPSAFLFWLENLQSDSTYSHNFDKLCIDLGLIDKPKKQSKVSIKEEIRKTIERSSKIIELDKKRNSRNECI